MLLGQNAREESVALEEAGFCVAAAPGVLVAPRGRKLPPYPSGAIALTLAGAPEELQSLAARAWNFPALAVLYERFYTVFSPLLEALRQGEVLFPTEAILARVLLIHEYRRIILRDPMLPVEILPPDWPGETAQTLCAEIYGRLCAASEI